MMTMDSYRWSQPSSSSSEVTTPGRSRPGMGGRAGTEPVAAMMWSAVSSFSPSSPLNRTRPVPRMVPVPRSRSTLAALNIPSIPPRSFALTSRLRWKMAFISKWMPSAPTPKGAPFLMPAMISEECSRVLVGMQPRLRQVPPTSRFSMTAVRRPCLAACSAAT